MVVLEHLQNQSAVTVVTAVSIISLSRLNSKAHKEKTEAVSRDPRLYCHVVTPAHTYLAIDGLDLLQGGQHKHSCLAHPRLGLAQDIHTQNGLGNTLMLD